MKKNRSVRAHRNAGMPLTVNAWLREQPTGIGVWKIRRSAIVRPENVSNELRPVVDLTQDS